jgi:hypothetical protein
LCRSKRAKPLINYAAGRGRGRGCEIPAYLRYLKCKEGRRERGRESERAREGERKEKRAREGE